ncbi:hypothetical protein ADUPG1_009413 [Aduncisulcus paluster]|uniref:Uncharacterized protein n=1 Tax=Aduncisulcus paluster TaxID=2918883 RepID=A0ABQ5KZF8_9EUKA|nr:hypothetical protein ADUPG1_009413 [Aduncisulcus paluster]
MLSFVSIIPFLLPSVISYHLFSLFPCQAIFLGNTWVYSVSRDISLDDPSCLVQFTSIGSFRMVSLVYSILYILGFLLLSQYPLFQHKALKPESVSRDYLHIVNDYIDREIDTLPEIEEETSKQSQRKRKKEKGGEEKGELDSLSLKSRSSLSSSSTFSESSDETDVEYIKDSEESKNRNSKNRSKHGSRHLHPREDLEREGPILSTGDGIEGDVEDLPISTLSSVKSLSQSSEEEEEEGEKGISIRDRVESDHPKSSKTSFWKGIFSKKSKSERNVGRYSHFISPENISKESQADQHIKDVYKGEQLSSSLGGGEGEEEGEEGEEEGRSSLTEVDHTDSFPIAVKPPISSHSQSQRKDVIIHRKKRRPFPVIAKKEKDETNEEIELPDLSGRHLLKLQTDRKRKKRRSTINTDTIKRSYRKWKKKQKKFDQSLSVKDKKDLTRWSVRIYSKLSETLRRKEQREIDIDLSNVNLTFGVKNLSLILPIQNHYYSQKSKFFLNNISFGAYKGEIVSVIGAISPGLLLLSIGGFFKPTLGSFFFHPKNPPVSTLESESLVAKEPSEITSMHSSDSDIISPSSVDSQVKVGHGISAKERKEKDQEGKRRGTFWKSFLTGIKVAFKTIFINFYLNSREGSSGEFERHSDNSDDDSSGLEQEVSGSIIATQDNIDHTTISFSPLKSLIPQISLRDNLLHVLSFRFSSFDMCESVLLSVCQQFKLSKYALDSKVSELSEDDLATVCVILGFISRKDKEKVMLLIDCFDYCSQARQRFLWSILESERKLGKTIFVSHQSTRIPCFPDVEVSYHKPTEENGYQMGQLFSFLPFDTKKDSSFENFRVFVLSGGRCLFFKSPKAINFALREEINIRCFCPSSFHARIFQRRLVSTFISVGSIKSIIVTGRVMNITFRLGVEVTAGLLVQFFIDEKNNGNLQHFEMADASFNSSLKQIMLFDKSAAL